MNLEVKESVPVTCTRFLFENEQAVVTPVVQRDGKGGATQVVNFVACDYAHTRACVQQMLEKGPIKGKVPETGKKSELTAIADVPGAQDDDAFCTSLDQKDGLVNPCIFARRAVDRGVMNLQNLPQ